MGALTILDVMLAITIHVKLDSVYNKYMIEAMGRRYAYNSFYRRCLMHAGSRIKRYGSGIKSADIYTKAAKKLKMAGYNGDRAVAVYLSIRFIVCPLLFLGAFSVNFPGILQGCVAAASVLISTEAVIAAKKKGIGLRLQKDMYKIYKYLHNQTSSGVQMQYALKNVYEVIDDKYLKESLIRLAARFELTMDLDASLDEFKSCYGVQEAETLCVAVRQGIMTGEGGDILARQEDMMFKKYFNYVQAETDSCRTRAVIAALMFTSIVVVMIAVPMFRSVSEAVGKIFIN